MANIPRNMKRMESRKSHSWWWDSHISPKNSKWLAENLEEMDRSVKRMLRLIEEEGDSFAKKAEMYYEKRPQLISHVEDFYRMYRSLAERYDHLTGELRKSIPSELQSQGSGISDVSSDPVSPMQTADRKLIRRKSSPRAAGFDFFLGSGGGSSDVSRKEVDESSSDSDSDTDDALSINNYSESQMNGDGGLQQRIIEVDVELQHMNEKPQMVEEENSEGSLKVMENEKYEDLYGRIAQYGEELVVANEKLRVSEEEIARLKNELSEETHNLQVQLELAHKDIEIRETEVNSERIQVLELQKRVEALEANVLVTDSKIEVLMEELKTKTEALQSKEEEIVRLKLELGKRGHLEANCNADMVSPSKDNEPHVPELVGRIKVLESDLLDRNCNIEALEQMLRITNERQCCSEEVIERLKHEVERNESPKAVTTLQIELESARKDIASLESQLELEKREILQLQVQIMIYKADISDRDQEVRKLQAAISDANRNFSLEKSRLQAEHSSLSTQHAMLEAKLEGWESKGQTLEEKIRQIESEKFNMQAQHGSEKMKMQIDIEQSKADITKKAEHIEVLNKSFDALKLKYDMLISDRDELNAKILALMDELSARDDRIHHMEENLHKSSIEHMELIKRSDVARKEVDKLQSRVKELEEEVEKQRIVILDGAEEKREAIRQLCFSLEHYRNGYEQLRQAFLGHRRQAVLAS
ncbi:PREDICTED: protein NETWORKED 4A-like [Nelumbo nucifera]|uniref:Protein NETWORKED 4A-like n=2 Tax=Nelumbo nucifera TaxID=4432 RepID=A0A1U7ZK54_NELNU|nr:PREDICTED: protein NETWORKED 4A-like [Nelumbo nucifera]XP_010252034.1 PREDICTED: protein NETWORKED 4A-like [Nelumbo nucifera]DAD38599.1 TPA_asm: hypothetical protein HUJ06_012921 [Nelumbo nucifera]